MSARQRLVAQRLAAKGPQAPPDEEFRQRWPQLFSILTFPLVVNGKVLDPMRLSFSIGNGDWQCTLSDTVLAQSLTTHAPTLLELLDRVNALVGSEAARWSPWRNKEPRLPKPRKEDHQTGLDVNGRRG